MAAMFQEAVVSTVLHIQHLCADKPRVGASQDGPGDTAADMNLSGSKLKSSDSKPVKFSLSNRSSSSFTHYAVRIPSQAE
ncbi:uncharacterized protein BDCG_06369 [Blastomyces dermatitidis ER-3]|uniref:Uncharacterized protein n=1 Tax=Ajellomyces dermatitidis (strain ER-3 / ATCC MYA-2586) TaxID=559297 RepID=A0ABP2F316_AJEDR|nr:uncharacterized protein BDCG_06369 [Blastomyces dermatitidis ER-3]EEQ91249.2 hypothetical protein BDCG_06369 [Blastomyces dermatitidis ER-3]EQL31374.1 hypothetical protein BDFG_06313 [Blastomyces dermatitidis ATCC 26199]